MDTSTWSLNAIVDRLTRHPRVAAILQVGSAADGRFSPASDYDLVIVLDDAPQPWFVGITTIDRRISDLIFVATSAVIALRQLRTAVAPDDPLAPIIRWIRSGVLRFDRSGTVRTIQQRLQQGEWILPVSDEEAFQAWFALNYNLAQTKWMSQAQDSRYRDTVQIRIAVYGPADLWFGYFKVRKIPWQGDKAAIQDL
jgi:predicted nucleotidyltransferase